ncbi:uncharacterized protein [Palaemon carinicauda]|uniref:uncharacterized protein n=1 Tax=Palaemon carinicauda TaxID=392227 RepID=UPI0035B59EDA
METFSKLRERRCSSWRCGFEWTKRGSVERVRDADAVVFFSLDLYAQPLPPRKPHQLWIWLELEAPPISQVATGPWSTAEKNGIYFNMTMSYHHLNDILTLNSALKPLVTAAECPLTTENNLDISSVTYRKYVEHLRKYDDVMDTEGSVWNQKILSQREGIKSSGPNPQKENSAMKNLVKDERSIGPFSSNETIEPSTVGLRSMAEKTNDSARDEQMKDIFHFTEQEVKWALRPKIAVWVASNCQTDSKRENLVAALQRHVRVTTVGKCGELKCGRNHHDSFCYRWFGSSHLFYLSLENALCEEYYSEKLWRPMEHNMVPIVYGGAKYNKILPPGSYINVQSYPNILALAKHLVYLSNNPVSYLRYLQWRRYWEVNEPLPWTCNLCSTLHKAAGVMDKRVTLDRWWNDTSDCYDPLLS